MSVHTMEAWSGFRIKFMEHHRWWFRYETKRIFFPVFIVANAVFWCDERWDEKRVVWVRQTLYQSYTSSKAEKRVEHMMKLAESSKHQIYHLHTYPSRLRYGKILSTHWNFFFSHFIHVFLCCSILISEIDFFCKFVFFCTPSSMILTLADSTLAASRRFLVCSSSCELLLLLRFLCCCSMMRDSLVNCFFVSLLLTRAIYFFTQAAIFLSVWCDDIKDTFNKEKKNFY